MAARTTSWAMALSMVAMAWGCGGSSTTPPTTDGGSDAAVGDAATDAAMDAATDAGPSCASGEMTCSGTCVDVTSDSRNCGSCGHACGDGEVCSAGSCATFCPAGQDACSGGCFDLQSDHDNCGVCGTACGADEVCVAGGCQLHCPAGQMDCDSTCVNEQTDGANCGSCGNACASGEVCSDGACGLTCAADLTTCGGTTDVDAGTGDAGTGDAGTGDAGTGDAGTSDAGTGDAGTGGGAPYCADLTTDRDNCGACGNVCADGYICSASTCVLSCALGQADCSDTCVDLQTDDGNCGTCGTACPSGQVCSGGTCNATCGGGTPTLCGTSCVNTDTDRANCGTCGTACDSGQVCVGGSCTFACGGGTPTLCGTSCVDTDTDRANCGTCGTACDPGQVCVMGACTASCGAGLTDCMGMCTDLDTDASNCGACGTTCDAHGICTSGLCVPYIYRRSCAEIMTFDRTAPDGVYTIDPDGPRGPVAPFQVFCDMSDDGGGWTLLLKADGTQGTFQYDQPIWTDMTTLNPTSTDISMTEAKFASYSTVPFTALLVVVTTDSSFGSAVLNVTANSLLDAESGGFTATSLGRANWLALFPGGGLQANCNQEGIANGSASPYGRVRIGIVGNQESDCGSPDSYAGIGGEVGPGNGCYGGAGGPGTSVGVENGGACGGSGSSVLAFGYVLARRWAASCNEIHAWDSTAPTGTYTIDPDGDGPVAPLDVHCDMTTDGGGWTLVLSTSGGNAITGIPFGAVDTGSWAAMPVATTEALATVSTQVHLRTMGQAATRSITSTPGSQPILNLQAGRILNDSTQPWSIGDYTGPFATAAHIGFDYAGCDTSTVSYPDVYWSCNNSTGLHLTTVASRWDLSTGTNEPMELYVR